MAKVWASSEPLRPYAQISLRPAFLLASEGGDPELSTGKATWQSARLAGHEFVKAPICWGRANDLVLDGRRRDWALESGDGDGWKEPEKLGWAIGSNDVVCHGDAWLLTPATLPPMLLRRWDKAAVRLGDAAWLRPWEGKGSFTIPPHSVAEVVLDLEDYVCGYNGVTRLRRQGRQRRFGLGRGALRRGRQQGRPERGGGAAFPRRGRPLRPRRRRGAALRQSVVALRALPARPGGERGRGGRPGAPGRPGDALPR